MRRSPLRPPVCEDCYRTFFAVFERINLGLAAPGRLKQEQLELKATTRARAVKFGDVWACPRCTKIEDGGGQQKMLEAAYGVTPVPDSVAA